MRYQPLTPSMMHAPNCAVKDSSQILKERSRQIRERVMMRVRMRVRMAISAALTACSFGTQSSTRRDASHHPIPPMRCSGYHGVQGRLGVGLGLELGLGSPLGFGLRWGFRLRGPRLAPQGGPHKGRSPERKWPNRPPSYLQLGLGLALGRVAPSFSGSRNNPDQGMAPTGSSSYRAWARGPPAPRASSRRRGQAANGLD